MTFRTHVAHLVRSMPLSELTKHLEFEMLGMKRFGFVPGQWRKFDMKPSCTRLKQRANPGSCRSGDEIE
jgi:hypothetical protein